MDIFIANPGLTLSYLLLATAAVVGLYTFFALMGRLAARADETPEERSKRISYK